MLLPIKGRAGVAIYMANVRSTELFQTGKAALENSGNLRKDIKDTVSESLQGLYMVTLELVDSRSRHKFQTECARAEGARELARTLSS